MLNIKEIAPKLTQKLSIAINDDEAVEFAEALIAELAKGNEPVAEVLSLFPGEPDSYINARAIGVDPFNTWTFPQPGTKLYTLPPTAEQIANETAEACAELADKMNPFPEPSAIGPEIRSGEWRKFVKEM